MSLQNRIRIQSEETLADDWSVLKKTTFDWRRSDGQWQTLSRETYDRGDGAVLLPFDPARKTVLLSKQFRFPAFVKGYDGLLIEAAAGLLDEAAPADRIRQEVEEELGLKLSEVRHVFTCFMSPGSVTEKLFFFTAEYTSDMRTSHGGGNPDEGEDIEVIELGLDQALNMIGSGEICDGKTIMLLQHLCLRSNRGGDVT